MDFGTPSTSRYRAFVEDSVSTTEARRRPSTKTPTLNNSPDDLERGASSLNNRCVTDLPRSDIERNSSTSTTSSIASNGIRSSNSSISRVFQGSRLRLQSLLRTFSNSSSPICRICHEGDQKQDLISPCYCSGTMGLVHVACMERWLSTTSSDTCELCHYKFKTKKTPKSFFDWLKDSTGRGRHQRSLVGDGVCFALLTPLASVGAFLCIEGAHQQAIEGNRMEAGCLVGLSSVLAVVYFLWTGLTCRYYYRQWKTWQLTNHNIQMIFLEKVVSAQPGPSASVPTQPAIRNESPVRHIEEVVIEPRPDESPSGIFEPPEISNTDIEAQLP